MGQQHDLYPKAGHYATFPTTSVKPSLALGSSPGDMVLDPFIGSGTAGLVALRMERRFVGIELNPEYMKIAEDRLLAREGEDWDEFRSRFADATGIPIKK